MAWHGMAWHYTGYLARWSQVAPKQAQLSGVRRSPHLEGCDEVDDVLVLQIRVNADLAVHLVVVQLAQVLHVVHLHKLGT